MHYTSWSGKKGKRTKRGHISVTVVSLMSTHPPTPIHTHSRTHTHTHTHAHTHTHTYTHTHAHTRTHTHTHAHTRTHITYTHAHTHQVYSKWERRAPLCPQHVRELTKDGVSVHVQPSKSRVFTDKEVCTHTYTYTHTHRSGGGRGAVEIKISH